MEENFSVSFSPQALEIIRNCLYPTETSMCFSEELELLTSYRYCNPTEEEELWQSLDWTKKIHLYNALDSEEKIQLLSLRSIEDLKQILLRLPQGYLLELRLILEGLNVLRRT